MGHAETRENQHRFNLPSQQPKPIGAFGTLPPYDQIVCKEGEEQQRDPGVRDTVMAIDKSGLILSGPFPDIHQGQIEETDQSADHIEAHEDRNRQ